jgi:hypothetical protein
MALNDPFSCLRCHGHCPYAGWQQGELIYRCASCGAENRVASRMVAQQQQQQQSQGKLPETEEP